MIRVDAIWLATEPLDMRAGTETAMARVGHCSLSPRPTSPPSTHDGPPSSGFLHNWAGFTAGGLTFTPGSLKLSCHSSHVDVT